MKSEYPSLRWGLSTLGCPELTLPEAVALADQYGMEFLELRTISNSSMVFNTLYLPENAPCARQLTAAGRCRVLDSAFFLAVQNDSAREELLKIARTADDFKIPYIRIFGRFPASGLSDELLEICCNNLNWFKNQNFQVQLALETHDTFCQVPKVMELMKCCGPMPVIWDAHHTARFADEALADSFGMLKENIIEVHFKDSHFEGAEKKYVGDIPGQGEMPLHELFTLLEKEKFPHPVIFEYEKFWQPELPAFTTALEAWHKMVFQKKSERS